MILKPKILFTYVEKSDCYIETQKVSQILIISPKTGKYCYTFLFLKKLSRSSLPEVFCEKGALRNFPKFTGKQLCQSLFLIELQAPLATLLKKRLWHRCFPVNFAKFLKTPFYGAPLVVASDCPRFFFVKMHQVHFTLMKNKI